MYKVLFWLCCKTVYKRKDGGVCWYGHSIVVCQAELDLTFPRPLD